MQTLRQRKIHAVHVLFDLVSKWNFLFRDRGAEIPSLAALFSTDRKTSKSAANKMKTMHIFLKKPTNSRNHKRWVKRWSYKLTFDCNNFIYRLSERCFYRRFRGSRCEFISLIGHGSPRRRRPCPKFPPSLRVRLLSRLALRFMQTLKAKSPNYRGPCRFYHHSNREVIIFFFLFQTEAPNQMSEAFKPLRL